MAKQQLEFLLALENSKFNRALNASQTKVAAAGRKMAAGVKPAIAGFKKLNATIALVGATAAAAAAAAALVALNSVRRESIDLANEQEAAEAKLEAVIKATGGAAGLSAEVMKKYASDLQSLTTYGDEVTISAMAVLATFKQIKGDEFKRSVKSAQDMAEVLNVDLNSSILQIGKALNDPVKGMTSLTRAGVQFTEQQKAQAKALQESGNLVGAQKIILKELEGQFGGAAEAARSFFGGIEKGVSNAKGDLFEEIGFSVTKNQFFIEGMKAAEQQIISWTDSLKKNQGSGREYAKTTGLAVLDMAQASMTGLDLMYRGLQGVIGSFRGTAAASLVLAGGVFKVVEASAALTDKLHLTDGAADKWKTSSEAAFGAASELAEEARENFAEFESGSGKIQAAREALEGFEKKVKDIPADAMEKTADAVDKTKTKTEELNQVVEDSKGDWGEVWRHMEREAAVAIDGSEERILKLTRDRNMTIYINEVVKKRWGGLMHFATGGKLAGYGGGDRIPALLEAGEYIIRKEAVSRFGAGIFHALNNLRLPALPTLPGFATGGPVGAGGGNSSGNGPGASAVPFDLSLLPGQKPRTLWSRRQDALETARQFELMVAGASS